jgi:biotin-(acetyl-CoA carboxylase) ligase
MCRGIDDRGGLIVENAEGMRRIYSGEVVQV